MTILEHLKATTDKLAAELQHDYPVDLPGINRKRAKQAKLKKLLTVRQKLVSRGSLSRWV